MRLVGAQGTTSGTRTPEAVSVVNQRAEALMARPAVGRAALRGE